MLNRKIAEIEPVAASGTGAEICNSGARYPKIALIHPKFAHHRRDLVAAMLYLQIALRDSLFGLRRCIGHRSYIVSPQSYSRIVSFDRAIISRESRLRAANRNSPATPTVVETTSDDIQRRRRRSLQGMG